MSRQAVRGFLDRITADDDLREQVASALNDSQRDPDVVLDVARRIGLDFSVAEFKEVLTERYGTLPEELSDAELGMVAGGVATFQTKSGGISLAFPDVCRLPGGPGPLTPIPYPNTGTGSGSSKKATGTKTTG